MADLSELDLKQEGRISILETKVDKINSMVEDIHHEYLARRARWSFVQGATKYVAWVGAGLSMLFGFSKSESFAGWLHAFPH